MWKVLDRNREFSTCMMGLPLGTITAAMYATEEMRGFSIANMDVPVEATRHIAEMAYDIAGMVDDTSEMSDSTTDTSDVTSHISGGTADTLDSTHAPVEDPTTND